MDQLLLVDDDSTIRKVLRAILSKAGYNVTTAVDGFDALLQMRKRIPDILISDLNMPHMSGFELLSVVRRRFPQVGVLAMSGAFISSKTNIIADHFFHKGKKLTTIVNVVRRMSALRIVAVKRQDSAPVWIPYTTDSQGMPYIVLTCTQCLRSFPLHIPEDKTQNSHSEACVFCESPVTYIIDFHVLSK